MGGTIPAVAKHVLHYLYHLYGTYLPRVAVAVQVCTVVFADTGSDIYPGYSHTVGVDDHNVCAVLCMAVRYDDLYPCAQGRRHDANQVLTAHAVPVAGLFLAEQREGCDCVVDGGEHSGVSVLLFYWWTGL